MQKTTFSLVKNHYFKLWGQMLATSAGILISAATVSANVLGSAGNYGVLAGTSVTNTGDSVVTGYVGVAPGVTITGTSPGMTVDLAHAAAAQTDLVSAYSYLTSLKPSATDLTGQNLGGLTLAPGVYDFSVAAQLTGTLTLDAQNNPDARFVFIIGSTLTTASSSIVNLVNVSTSVEGANNGIYWIVGSSATLGNSTSFAGSILAITSITINNDATIASGRALAIGGTVTLDANNIDASDVSGGFGVEVPEPSTYALIGSSIALAFTVLRRKTVRRRSVG